MSGKYRVYPEYKDSEVEMLGELPSSWNTKQVRYLLKNGAEGIKIGPFGSALKLEDMVDSGTRVYGQENVIKKDFTLGKRKISQSKFEEMKVYQVNTDDLLITMMGTSGKCELVPENADLGIIDSHLLRLRVKESEILPRFFRLLIDECYEIENQIKISGKGSIMHGLNSSIVKSLILPLPSNNEQRVILNFLDHETVKIDTLIEKQQQLIRLLKEKRQAVISHAVTKGLNPDAPMRDSGVEWLGEVPEHWIVSRIKNVVTKIVDGPHFSPKYHDEGFMFISARNIKVDCWSLDDAKYVSEADFIEFNKRVKPEKGDVLLTKGGTTGVARAVDLDFPFQIWVHVAVLKTIQTIIDPFYLAYVLNGTACYEQSQQYTFGATNNDLGLSRIAKIFFARPPIEEQRELCLWVDGKCKKYDNLIAKGVESIDLMKERRTALISAAVTGKIDVRNWNYPEFSNKKENNKEVAA